MSTATEKQPLLKIGDLELDIRILVYKSEGPTHPIPIFEVEIIGNDESVWNETCGSPEQLEACLAGMKAMAHMLGARRLEMFPGDFVWAGLIAGRHHDGPFQLWPDKTLTEI